MMGAHGRSPLSAKLGPKHRNLIEQLVERFGEDGRFEAGVVTGSVAKGRATESSDLDVIFVATEEEFERRAARHDFSLVIKDLSPNADNYVDGKVVSLRFLRDCAERGSEMARAEFADAFVAFSRIPDLEEILKRITAYPEDERSEKIKSFFAMVSYHLWMIPEAEKRADKFLLTHSAAELVLYAGRLVLAHNRVLYPGRKWLMHEVAHAREKPEGFAELAEKLLANPCKENAKALGDAVLNFTQWERPAEGWVSWFMENWEWAWRKGKAPLQDR